MGCSFPKSISLFIIFALFISCSLINYHPSEQETKQQVILYSQNDREYKGKLVRIDRDSVYINRNNQKSVFNLNDVSKLEFISERSGSNWNNIRDIADSTLDRVVKEYLTGDYDGELNPSDFIILYNKLNTRVNSDSTSSTTYRVIAKVLSEQGEEELGTRSFLYNTERENIEINHAIIVTSEGLVNNLEQDNIENSPLYPKNSEYSRMNHLKISLPSLRKGDIVDYSVTIRREAFSDRHPLSLKFTVREKEPILKSIYRVHKPSNLDLKIGKQNFTEKKDYDWKKVHNHKGYNWTFEDIPGYTREPMMPPESYFLPQLYVTSPISKKNISRNYEKLFQVDSDKLSKLTRQHKSKLSTPLGGYEFTLRQFESPDIPLKHSHYFPRSIDSIITSGEGTVLDKTYLASLLLDRIDIESNLCLLASNEIGKIPPEIYSPKFFDTVLLKVYEADSNYFLSFHNAKQTFGNIPLELQGCPGIEIGKGKVTRITSPYQQKNGLRDSIVINIDENGDAKIFRQIKYLGNRSTSFREFRERPKFEIEREVLGEVSGTHPDAELISYELFGMESLRSECKIRMNFKVEEYLQEMNDNLLSLNLPELNYSTWHVDLQERSYPLFQEGWSENSNFITVNFPRSLKPYYLPPDTNFRVDSLFYRTNTKFSDTSLTFRDYTIRRSSIFDTSSFKSFKELTHNKMKYNDEFILLKKKF